MQVNVETTPGGYSIIGLNFGPSKAGALDIPGIRYGLGISGDPLKNPARFDITAFQPTKPLGFSDPDEKIMYTSDHSWVNGCYPNTIAFGLMFNANGIDPFDEQTLFRAMKEAEASQSKAAGNWDCNRFWVCLTGVNYATWGLSALIYALTEGQVLIGTTMGYQPSMFILMEKQLGPGHLKQIKKYYLDAFGGVS